MEAKSVRAGDGLGLDAMFSSQRSLAPAPTEVREAASVASVRMRFSGTFETNRMLRTGPWHAIPVP